LIKLDITGATPFLGAGDHIPEAQVAKAAQDLYTGNGIGSKFTGWVDLPETYDRAEFKRIKSAAEEIKAESDVLLVVGIGGSYLGARAAIELLRSPNYNLVTKPTPNIYFVGNNLSAEHLSEIMHLLRDKNFSLNVISKSGETTEPAVTFRILRNMMERRYGDVGARSRIYVTADKNRGVLKQMADREGFQTFGIPDTIGGRYSVLTAAGLLPMAVAGVDIDRVMAGAYDAMQTYTKEHSMKNPVWQYAATRQALYKKGKSIEILACYEPAFRFMAEWWKQLYGESEGKDGGGIFPASVELTTDLHSMGQYIQDGTRTLMETVVSFDTFRRDIEVPLVAEDVDGLNYLAGSGMERINAVAKRATIEAHIAGGVPTMEITLPDMGETAFGWLVYFFQLACGVSGYIQGVNPFDQPGVEAYKKNMFRLLGKPGY